MGRIAAGVSRATSTAEADPITTRKGRRESVVGDQEVHALLIVVIRELRSINIQLASITGEHIRTEDS
jgi:hypothetical protein